MNPPTTSAPPPGAATPPPPMAPPRGWADLPSDLLSSVADRLHAVAAYVAARGVCAAWRSALPPAAPPFLLMADADSGAAASALSLSARRAFRLPALPTRTRCVGSGHGWLAVTGEEAMCYPDTARYRRYPWTTVSYLRRIALLNPWTGEQIVLPYHERLKPSAVIKIAFAPNPRAGDFTVVVASGHASENHTLAYASTRDGGGGRGGATWSFVEIDTEKAVLADVVYREGRGGGEDDGGDKVYCLAKNCSVYVLHLPRGGAAALAPVLEPLLPEPGAFFHPALFFAPIYARLSVFFTSTSARNLVFCDGDLYQIWRNCIGGAVILSSPTGAGDDDRFRVPKDEVFVLRYCPERLPCWEAVADLGGHSVFVGPASGAVVVRAAEHVPGLKGDCVYWVSPHEDRHAMVFDMKTRRCTPCPVPSTGRRGGGTTHCWFSLEDTASSGDDGEEETLEGQPKRRRIA
ncbi:hypothetical protein ACP4OV_024383 [Aristida adscensionis]